MALVRAVLVCALLISASAASVVAPVPAVAAGSPAAAARRGQWRTGGRCSHRGVLRLGCRMYRCRVDTRGNARGAVERQAVGPRTRAEPARRGVVGCLVYLVRRVRGGGKQRPGSAVADPLAESWRGTRWAVLPVPHPVGTGAVLSGVACTSDSVCIAVGTITNARSGAQKSLAER